MANFKTADFALDVSRLEKSSIIFVSTLGSSWLQEMSGLSDGTLRREGVSTKYTCHRVIKRSRNHRKLPCHHAVASGSKQNMAHIVQILKLLCNNIAMSCQLQQKNRRFRLLFTAIRSVRLPGCPTPVRRKIHKTLQLLYHARRW